MPHPTLALSADPLAPIRSTLAEMAAQPHLPALNGLAATLTVRPADVEAEGWTSASALVSGAALDALLDAAKQRWRATPHAAAALAFKCYSYWVALPAVLGYAAARRVPLVSSADIVARWSSHQPFVTVGLLPTIRVAVLPGDPLALLPAPTQRQLRVTVLPDEAALIAIMRETLMDEHLGGVLEQLRSGLRLGRRTLWGSLAAGIAHGLSRAADVIPGPILTTATDLLVGLGLDDLVEVSERPSGRPGLSIQRRTCCLAFTLPEPKICAGCCIR